MNGFIARLNACLSRYRGKVAAAPASPASINQVDRRELARRLTLELDLALQQGKTDLANRIAASAMRIASAHPQLSDRIARLRLAQNDPESALVVIESCTWQSASLRLLRVTCLLMLGRKHEAHLDLQQWCRRASAPLQARQLLATLAFEAGDVHAAIQSLLCNLKQIEDPMTLLMLAVIGTAQGRDEWTNEWCARLHALDRDEASSSIIEPILFSIQQQQPRHLRDALLMRRIETLAAELVANEHVIPVLVESQRLQPDTNAQELIAGIERALPMLEDQPAALLALQQLRAMSQQPHAFIEPRSAPENNGESARPMCEPTDYPSDVLATIGNQQANVRERAA